MSKEARRKATAEAYAKQNGLCCFCKQKMVLRSEVICRPTNRLEATAEHVPPMMMNRLYPGYVVKYKILAAHGFCNRNAAKSLSMWRELLLWARNFYNEDTSMKTNWAACRIQKAKDKEAPKAIKSGEVKFTLGELLKPANP